MPTALFILLAIAVFLVILAVMKVFTKKNVKNFVLVIAVVLGIYAVVGLLGSYGVVSLGNSGQFFMATTGGAVLNPTVPTSGNVVSTYQPTATYSAKDKFATTTVSGTSYYKEDNLPATTTAKTNVNIGKTYTYWVSNTTGYFVKPKVLSISEPTTSFVADSYKNSTPTLTLYDLTNRASVTDGGSSNISLVANGQANVELTYIGVSKQSALPFGGVFVVEYNSSISTVTCTGADLTEVNPYHLTYTVGYTGMVYKAYAVATSLDDGSASGGKKINCQLLNGAVAQGAGESSYVQFKFIPANYYASQSGDIILDTEKFADSDTTRTNSFNNPSVKLYWI